MSAWDAVAGWVDRWYRVRWRALLTWVVLAGVMNWLLTLGLVQALFNGAEYCRAQMEALISRPIPALFAAVWAGGTLTLASTWHQPLALRIGKVRGWLWIALAMAGSAGFQIAQSLTPWGWGMAVLAFFLPSLSLIGRRDCWGWALPGAIAAVAVFAVTRQLRDGMDSALPVWWIGAAGQFPYAFALLFGTRERVRAPADSEFEEA